MIRYETALIAHKLFFIIGCYKFQLSIDSYITLSRLLWNVGRKPVIFVRKNTIGIVKKTQKLFRSKRKARIYTHKVKVCKRLFAILLSQLIKTNWSIIITFLGHSQRSRVIVISIVV